jgi:hypothetical protein
MQQDKNDIENKLRQLENQQLPDLSQMDAHWAGMKAALQPAAAKEGGSNKRLWVISLLLLAGAVILFVNYNAAIKKDEPVLSKISVTAEIKPDVKKADAAATSTMPVKKMPVNKTLSASVPTKIVKNKSSKNETDKNFVNLPVQLNSTDSTLKAVNPDAQKILNELLASLAKNAEEFIIDNSRDTILFATGGSSLYVPAKSLGGSNRVKISLREFYKTSDIVMNKLSTTSNGEQLITGGMVHISATANDKPVDILPGKTIKWYLPDTSTQMEQMQLFKGEEKASGEVKWINTEQRFGGRRNIVEVRVLNLCNEPFKTIESDKGTIGYFSLSENSKLSKSELKSVLKEKFGYYKVRIRRIWSDYRLFQTYGKLNTTRIDGIGDSVWINKELADKYNLQATQTRIRQGGRGLLGGSILRIGYSKPKLEKNRKGDTLMNDDRYTAFDEGLNKLQKKYSIDIGNLGWINCDRFYNDRREKIDYYVNLQDSAVNYYTMIVFNKLRSMMAGYVTGSKVYFTNVPMGEPVKIISIGIDKKGETVMAMKETKISKDMFTGLQFESTSASAIKSTLRKEDN